MNAMVGTRVQHRALRGGLPLLAVLVGCMPNLDELRDNQLGGDIASSNAGASGAAGAGSALALGGSGAVPGAGGGAAGSGMTSAGFAGATNGGAFAAGAGGMLTSAGAAPVCVPHGVETCNGMDDDCNGVKDDGCPSAVSTVFKNDLPIVGDSPGGGVFADDCADGEVLGGLKVGIDVMLSQVRGVCRKVQLQLRADAPGTYNVLLTNERELAPHPDTTDNVVQQLSCLENEALIEIHIGEQPTTSGDQPVTVIPKIWLNCAKLTLSAQSGGGYAINWEGKRDMPPLAGSLSNGTAYFADSSAPTGTVPTRLRGTSGAWIDRIGLGVSTLQVIVAH